VHGFFAVMGGFVDGKEVLSLDRIEELVRNEEIEYPIVSRQEIEDRSKGDAVTKALVVSQTAWFLLQCAARASQHLALTELELATAAFAVLNIIMYVLWWDKPLDVQCPITVRRRTSGIEVASEEQDRTREENKSAREWNWWSCFRGWSWYDIFDVWVVIKPFLVMMGLRKEDDVFLVVGEREWFSKKTENLLLIGGTLVTMVFGGTHCIRWSFDFPSHTEQLLWRISSISITRIPLGYVVIHMSPGRLDTLLLIKLFVLLSFLYILSRVLLLVVSLTALRSLPSSAFQTVEWTTFLPHI
jgi:hypothetical protein